MTEDKMQPISMPAFKPKVTVEVAAEAEPIPPVEEMLGHTRPEQIPGDVHTPLSPEAIEEAIAADPPEPCVPIDPEAPLAHKKVEDLAPHELEVERQRLTDKGRLYPEGMTGGNLTRFCEVVTQLRKTRAGPAKSKKNEPSLPSLSLDDIPKL